ncbi:MAG: hypothetical protein COB15_10795 [Flavobacteriales bacterium]|nr:MAG: hypothetical protein COB15_10795 [Flavobacteriales bacterium]
MNQFNKTGAFKLYNRKGISLFVITVLLIGFLSAKTMLTLPILLGFIVTLFIIIKFVKNPSLTLTVLFSLSFILLGSTRFIQTTLPVGLTVDILLTLSWIIVLLKSNRRTDWSIKNNLLTNCMAVWALYNVLQIFNPESVSIEAWFYAVRAIALYPLLLVPLVFLIYNQQKDYRLFINIWFMASMILALYGLKQFYFGVNRWEQAWLDAGADITHVLWNRLRVFSFLCDAGQFGVFQAQAGTTALIFAIGELKTKRRIFYWLTAILSFIGMIISGTRGVLVVPIIGLFVFLIFSKNLKLLITGFIIGGICLYLLIFTMSLNRHAPIARMRTAFNTQDASLNVRKENRLILDKYLENRPFGGGIGSAGSWGARFSPDTFLAKFQTDGQYVRIYAEEGIVGLYLYIGLFSIILCRMLWITWHLKTPILSQQMIGLTCGILGVMVANYGNSYSSQIPSNLIFFWCMAFVYMAPKWDKGEEYPKFGDLPQHNNLEKIHQEEKNRTIDNIKLD